MSSVEVPQTEFTYPSIAACGIIPPESAANLSLLRPEEAFKPWIHWARQDFLVEEESENGVKRKRQENILDLKLFLNICCFFSCGIL